MKHYAHILVAAALASTAAMAHATTSVKATVNGMVCAFCAQGIEKRLSALPAARTVFVDLKQRVVLVEAREGQSLNLKAITDEITDAGYEVKQLETVEQSVAEIRGALKATP